jgi:hypothetical protein
MDEIVKLRCPHCDGKVALDEAFYAELIGQSINCPHCSEGMKIPTTVKKITRDREANFRGNSRTPTQKVRNPATEWTPPLIRVAETEEKPVYCPKCKEEVGRRDRVCVSCGTKLTPSDLPPNC